MKQLFHLEAWQIERTAELLLRTPHGDGVVIYHARQPGYGEVPVMRYLDMVDYPSLRALRQYLEARPNSKARRNGGA